jgi:hypothetical protein
VILRSPSLDESAKTQANVVTQKKLQTTFGHPLRKLRVRDVEQAQQHYRKTLGFEIGTFRVGSDHMIHSLPNLKSRNSAPYAPNRKE